MVYAYKDRKASINEIAKDGLSATTDKNGMVGIQIRKNKIRTVFEDSYWANPAIFSSRKMTKFLSSHKVILHGGAESALTLKCQN